MPPACRQPSGPALVVIIVISRVFLPNKAMMLSFKKGWLCLDSARNPGARGFFGLLLPVLTDQVPQLRGGWPTPAAAWPSCRGPGRGLPGRSGRRPVAADEGQAGCLGFR